MTGARHYRRGYRHGLEALKERDRATLLAMWEDCASFPADDYDRGYLAAVQGKPNWVDETTRQRIRRGYWVGAVALGVLIACLL